MNPPYWSFLLRIWRASPPETFRASLENARTHEVTGFTNPQALFEYLSRMVDEPAPTERTQKLPGKDSKGTNSP